MTKIDLAIWVIGICIELAAIYAIIWGVKYEAKHKASFGVLTITLGCGSAVIGSFLFSKVLPLIK